MERKQGSRADLNRASAAGFASASEREEIYVPVCQPRFAHTLHRKVRTDCRSQKSDCRSENQPRV